MITTQIVSGQEANPLPTAGVCEHRQVSKDGRIVCTKIVEGDNEVTPNVCRTCPFKAANCTHLRFSLRQVTPSPLIVRFNGRTEVWDDDPPHVQFEQAACAARVSPIDHPKQCANCALRQALHERPGAVREQGARRRRRAAQAGQVVPFPGWAVPAAAG
jgi:hypothetical protein